MWINDCCKEVTAHFFAVDRAVEITRITCVWGRVVIHAYPAARQVANKLGDE